MSEMVSVQLGFKPNSQALPRCLIQMEKLTDLPQITQLLWAEVGPEASSQSLSLAQSELVVTCPGSPYEQVKPCKASQSTLLFLPPKPIPFQKWPLPRGASLPTLHRPSALTLFPLLGSNILHNLLSHSQTIPQVLQERAQVA